MSCDFDATGRVQTFEDQEEIGDLEDLGVAVAAHLRSDAKKSRQREEFESQVQPRNLIEVEDSEENNSASTRRPTKKKVKEEIVGYDIPGTQTVYLKTYGCSHNSSDSEYMAGLLAEYGYSITETFSKADVFLMNSCTVKNPSQDSFFSLVEKAKETGKPVIVAGCVPQGQPSHSMFDGLSVIGVQQIDRVVEVVEQAVKGNTVKFMGRTKKHVPKLDLPKIRRNPFIEIVPINLGCLNQCTYCKTKHARGNLVSYTIEEICERIESVVREGVIEVRITSEDTGAYGKDIGTDLPTLLRRIVNILPDGVMLKVGMTNPPYILEHLDSIAELLNHPRVYGFLHVPVQSGSTSVLKAMAREYTKDEFRRVASTLSSKVPGMTIATDIICGFPTETEEDFEETLELIREFKFPIVNISQFYPRPGTPAARMKRVPTEVVKDRSRRLTRLFESYQTYDDLVGTEQRVWITERATDGVNLVGHTKTYVQVLIDPSEAEIGCEAIVNVVSASKWAVNGKVISIQKKNVAPPPSIRRKPTKPKQDNDCEQSAKSSNDKGGCTSDPSTCPTCGGDDKDANESSTATTTTIVNESTTTAHPTTTSVTSSTTTAAPSSFSPSLAILIFLVALLAFLLSRGLTTTPTTTR